MRKIRLTEEEIRSYVEEFSKMLQKGTTCEKIKLEIKVGKIENPPEKAKVIFTPLAWLKMSELVAEFTTEVAWHFLVRRGDDPASFVIYDVLVYPQAVESAFVDMDEAEYAMWRDELDDDTFNSIRGQGHSHVNMGVSPSGTDLDIRKKLVSQITEKSVNPFYVFCIMNKKHDISFEVFDVENNIAYENSDVTYYVYDNTVDLVSFITKSKELAKPNVRGATVKKNTSVTRPATYVDDFEWQAWKDNMWKR